MHFGDDFLLTSFFRPYTVRALTFLDCFRVDRAILYQMFQYGQFPLFQASGGRPMFLMGAPVHPRWFVFSRGDGRWG
jgi:hypothetical protein